MQELRNLLDDQGVIDRLDFENAIDFDEILKSSQDAQDLDDVFQSEKQKKFSH